MKNGKKQKSKILANVQIINKENSFPAIECEDYAQKAENIFNAAFKKIREEKLLSVDLLEDIKYLVTSYLADARDNIIIYDEDDYDGSY